MRCAILAAITVLGLARGGDLDKAVEEFRVVTRDLGLRADSVVRKNGSAGPKAAWHGRIFENWRNDALDAVPHEARQAGANKSTLRRNQFGFNVAGPVVVPHLYHGNRTTFFSLSYEGVRENVSRSQLRTVPTAAERTGDFSASVDSAGVPLRFFDPASTRRNPSFDSARAVSEDNLEYLRDPFPGNRIPVSRLDAVAGKALAYYPQPNASVGPYDRNNFFIHSPESNTADGVIGKLDHSVGERHRLSLGLQSSTGALGSARWFDNGANPGPSDRKFQNRRGSLEHVFTASARTVNTLTIEVNANSTVAGGEDAANYSAAIGLKGAGGRAFPIFELGSYVQMGQWVPSSRNVRNTYVFTDTFSTRRGKHSLRAIVQYTAAQVNSYGPGSPSGYFDFSSGLTSLPGIVNTGHSFASFLLGLASYSEVSLIGSPSYFRNGSALIGLRDNFEATKGLNLSFGLNIQPSLPRREKYNRQSTVDLNTINPANEAPGALIAADGARPAFKPAVVTFGPSAGLSWNPAGDTKTVLRASFWRNYSTVPLYFGQWGTQGFNSRPTFTSPNSQLEPAVTLASGLPAYDAPALGPTAANDTVADLADRSSLLPLYQGASLQLEREMPGSVLLTLGAMYAGGRNLLVGNNAVNPDALPFSALAYRDALNDEAFNLSLRPYPQYKGFDVSGLWPRGRYQRDSGFLNLEKRASQGLTLSFKYEFSKQLDDYSGPNGSQDYFDSRNEWSITPWQSPQTLSLSYVYELPIGSNRRLFSFDDWRRHLADGWSVSGVSTFYAGDPIALRPLFNNTGGVVAALHVNAVPGVEASLANQGPEQWFNAAAFDQPADFTLGNVSRTHPTLRNPGSQNLDLSLVKRFALAPDRSLEFSAVGLNFLNHGNWNDPDPVIGPESSPNTNAGKITGSTGGRILQLGLRFTF